MKKIPSLFVMDYTNPRAAVVTRTVTPGCEWVIAGEGTASRKWDGTAVMIDGSKLFRRYDAKRGKAPPAGFIPAQDPDPITGHWPGWIEVKPWTPEPSDVWIALAYLSTDPNTLGNGTYEAIGPRINGNNEHRYGYKLQRHGNWTIEDAPRDYDGLRAFLASHEYEGIIFKHADGRMAKIRRDHFGLVWPIPVKL